MNPELQNLYGNNIRVRVCGLCWQNGDLLMVNHKGLSGGDLWAPPGGGLEFGERAVERLQIEFLEEAGLKISVGGFRFVCEFVARPLHAIELFFDVDIIGGSLAKGRDPELDIINDVRFMSVDEIATIPSRNIHGIFGQIKSPIELRKLNGFFRI